MNDSSTIKRLSNAIGKATKSAKFSVSGTLSLVDPGLDVDGVGRIKFPLMRTKKALIAQCRVAPYGKGTKTLVDCDVRNTYELDPKKFRLSEQWNAAIIDETARIAEQLDLPAD